MHGTDEPLVEQAVCLAPCAMVSFVSFGGGECGWCRPAVSISESMRVSALSVLSCEILKSRLSKLQHVIICYPYFLIKSYQVILGHNMLSVLQDVCNVQVWSRAFADFQLFRPIV